MAYSGTAQAQAYICPNGPGPGENQVGTTPGGNGVASMPLCASDGSGPSGGGYQRRYVHVDTYAAAAYHPAVGDFWFVGARALPGQAEPEALRRCNAAMGGGCKSLGEFTGSALGFARNDRGELWSARAGDALQARDQAIADCSKDQILTCQWWTSRNSYDHDYTPDLTKRRYRFAVAAWIKPSDGGHPSQLYLASGRDSYAAAEAAAMAACRAQSGASGAATCVIANWVGNGFIQTARDETGRVYAISEVTEQRARDAAMATCRIKRASDCRLQTLYDSRISTDTVHDFSTNNR